MKLFFLGSGGYFPNRRRHTACLMIPELGVVLDAGTAAFEIGKHLQTDRLEIFLSHAHLDHVFGLTCLLTLYDGDPGNRIRVHGDPAKLAAVQEHLFSELLFPVAPPCEFVPLEHSVALPGEGVLRWFPLEHPGGSIGMRLEWPGHSLAYVTDTTARLDAEYLDAIRGVDLLVHEAYFSDADQQFAQLTGHSCVTEVARVAAEVGARRLILVHSNPLFEDDAELQMGEALEVFPQTQLAHDGMAVDF